MSYECMKCGEQFNNQRAAEKAELEGCPNCGGVDIVLSPANSSDFDSGELYDGALWEKDAEEIIGFPNRENPIAELWRFKNFSVVLYAPTMVKRRFTLHEDARAFAEFRERRANGVIDRLGGW